MDAQLFIGCNIAVPASTLYVSPDVFFRFVKITSRKDISPAFSVTFRPGIKVVVWKKQYVLVVRSVQRSKRTRAQDKISFYAERVTGGTFFS